MCFTLKSGCFLWTPDLCTCALCYLYLTPIKSGPSQEPVNLPVPLASPRTVTNGRQTGGAPLDSQAVSAATSHRIDHITTQHPTKASNLISILYYLLWLSALIVDTNNACFPLCYCKYIYIYIYIYIYCMLRSTEYMLNKLYLKSYHLSPKLHTVCCFEKQQMQICCTKRQCLTHSMQLA